MTDGRQSGGGGWTGLDQVSRWWTEVWTEVWTWSPHLDGRPPPPALGFRWSPEPDYPPPT